MNGGLGPLNPSMGKEGAAPESQTEKGPGVFRIRDRVGLQSDRPVVDPVLRLCHHAASRIEPLEAEMDDAPGFGEIRICGTTECGEVRSRQSGEGRGAPTGGTEVHAGPHVDDAVLEERGCRSDLRAAKWRVELNLVLGIVQ